MKLQVVRQPVILANGSWFRIPVDQWKVSYKANTAQFVLKTAAQATFALNASDIIAVELLEERQANAIGATLGRMALTGIGSALFTKGRAGGLGAGVLDLSFRGMEQRSVVSGLVIFSDLAMLRFNMSPDELSSFAHQTDPRVFSEEALIEAKDFVELVGRMNADGHRVIDELAAEIAEHKETLQRLTVESEQGSTFAQRDRARQELASATAKSENSKRLLKVLLFEQNLLPGGLGAPDVEGTASTIVPSSELLQSSDSENTAPEIATPDLQRSVYSKLGWPMAAVLVIATVSGVEGLKWLFADHSTVSKQTAPANATAAVSEKSIPAPQPWQISNGAPTPVRGAAASQVCDGPQIREQITEAIINTFFPDMQSYLNFVASSVTLSQVVKKEQDRSTSSCSASGRFVPITTYAGQDVLDHSRTAEALALRKMMTQLSTSSLDIAYTTYRDEKGELHVDIRYIR